MKNIQAFFLALLLISLLGCGQTGSLYLPAKAKPIVKQHTVFKH